MEGHKILTRSTASDYKETSDFPHYDLIRGKKNYANLHDSSDKKSEGTFLLAA